jgi:hypothetical protein
MLNSAPQHFDVGIYQPRYPQASGYFRCVQDHFEQLEMQWQDRYAPRYGFWRSYVTDVIYRYLECGDLHFGFARVRCQDCGHEYLLAYSCKRRHFCPSCHQKRVLEFGQWLCSRGMRKKADIDDQVPALAESAVSSVAFRRNWARLIQKIYQIDPLLCPKCQGLMKIISLSAISPVGCCTTYCIHIHIDIQSLH